MSSFRYLSFVIVLCATACSTTNKTRHADLVLREGGKLNLDVLWPLESEGNYLQRLTMRLRDGREYMFSVHLSLSPNSIKAVAFHDVYGRLYQLSLTPQTRETQMADVAKTSFRPEDILVDFLVSHLPHDKLLNLTKGFKIRETEGEAWLLLKDGQPFRKVSRSGPISTWMWQSLTLENIPHGYSLHVESVEQP